MKKKVESNFHDDLSNEEPFKGSVIINLEELTPMTIKLAYALIDQAEKFPSIYRVEKIKHVVIIDRLKKADE